MKNSKSLNRSRKQAALLFNEILSVVNSKGVMLDAKLPAIALVAAYVIAHEYNGDSSELNVFSSMTGIYVENYVTELERSKKAAVTLKKKAKKAAKKK